MSCNYNVYCKTCDSDSDYEVESHQKWLILVLIKHKDLIAKLPDLLNDSENDLRLVEDRGQNWSPRIDCEWFKKHSKHELVCRDEYGKIDGQCYERIKCPKCETDKRCVLPLGHSGEHSVLLENQTTKTSKIRDNLL